MAKIDTGLLRRMAKDAEAAPGTRFPLIVTLKPGAGAEKLESAGLSVEHRFAEISALSGSATFAEVKRLADLEEVERIEFDGEMHAL